MKRGHIRLLFFPLLLLSAAVPALGDNILGFLTTETRVRVEGGFQQNIELSLEEIAAVRLDGHLQFLRGLEVELLLSNHLKRYFDSFGLAVYKAVDPEPGPGLRGFTGSRVALHFLPYQNRIYLFVPIAGLPLPSTLPEGTSVSGEVGLDEFPLLITMVPLMKGIPDSVIDSKFFLTLRPIVDDRGLFELKIQPAADQPYQVTIDGQPVPDPSQVLELAAGLHQLRIVSPAYEEVNAAFTVAAGKKSLLEVALRESASTIGVDFPLGAQVYLDGERLPIQPKEKWELQEGFHTIRIMVGDSSISRRFQVQRGKHYEISLTFDIIIVGN